MGVEIGRHTSLRAGAIDLFGGQAVELTYRLTREDHQRFVRLAVARVRQHANQVTGWHSKPAVVTSAAVLLGMLPLVYLLFAELISPLGYFVAAFAYV
jgi:hypothetical protein